MFLELQVQDGPLLIIEHGQQLPGPVGHRLVRGRAMVAAVGYSNGTAAVKLSNPWGFNAVNGQRSGAEIVITWNDFVRNFQEVTID